MRKIGLKLMVTLYLGIITSASFSQMTLGFEEFTIEQDSFLNGSDLSGGFQTDIVFLPNLYNEDWASWEGWSLSNVTDNLTAGFTNQYSCIAGNGNLDSENYAVSFVNGATPMNVDISLPAGFSVTGFYINNATYTYLSMLNGDAFAKKFGGETGNDPDFLLLTIKGFFNGDEKADSIDFYLADYRFEDNTLDYLVDDWTFVDISDLSLADSISFSLSSSDNGQFGMNTPAYFCLDDIQTDFHSSNKDIELINDFRIFPNPAKNFVELKSSDLINQASIYAIDGTLKLSIRAENIKKIDLNSLPPGLYILELNSKNSKSYQQLIKH